MIAREARSGREFGGVFVAEDADRLLKLFDLKRLEYVLRARM